MYKKSEQESVPLMIEERRGRRLSSTSKLEVDENPRPRRQSKKEDLQRKEKSQILV